MRRRDKRPYSLFLLDKTFIIFIAREHDEQGERNTIRSECTERSLRVSWNLIANFYPNKGADRRPIRTHSFVLLS